MVSFHPEYLKAVEPMLPIMAQMVKPAVGDVEGRREQTAGFLVPALKSIPLSPDVEITTHHVTAKDGYSVPIYHYRKKDTATEGSLPAIFHTHGGGYISLSADDYMPVVAAMVAATGIQVFSVDYRLAPEHPFPIPIEDAYAGLLWLNQHSEPFNVDPARICVFGDSAGGGLAACLAIMARDKNLSPPLAKQVLIYPMLDDRNQSPSPLDKFLFWNNVDNVTGWTAYIGKDAGKDGTSPYAAAARVQSVEGLPRTYIDVGGLDLFLSEDIQYASRLAAANIEVEFHLYPGLPHGFEMMAGGTDLVKGIQMNRYKALASF